MTTSPVDVVAQRDPGAVLAARRIQLGPRTWIGPCGHLATERQRLAELQWEHFDVSQLGTTVGAEVSGLDLRDDLPAGVVADLRRAWLAYKVLFFRDQELTAEQHVAFARRFGELEIHPFIPGNEQVPELVRFAKDAETGGYENGWHHDVTWREVPSRGAILRAIDVPATGGDTMFCDMAAAYEGLADDVKARLEGLYAVHDFMQAFGHQVPADKKDEMRARYPAVRHPVVIRHAETGARLLYVNRFFVSHIEGLEPDESAELVELLCLQSETPEYHCRFRWRASSIAFWDNQAVQHYAASDYWPDVRVMERASIVGTRPAA